MFICARSTLPLVCAAVYVHVIHVAKSGMYPFACVCGVCMCALLGVARLLRTLNHKELYKLENKENDNSIGGPATTQSMDPIKFCRAYASSGLLKCR